MLIVAFSYCYAECRYAECRYAECRYAECRYVECRYAECLSRKRFFARSLNLSLIFATFFY
jgi:hypothetical protein